MCKAKSDIPSSVPTAYAGFRLCIVIDGYAKRNLIDQTLFFVSCVKIKNFIIQNEKFCQILCDACRETQSKTHLSHEMISAKLT